VDTSIEHDHERFDGFLKVSLEEVLIALRDDRHLLMGPEQVVGATWTETPQDDTPEFDKPATLYPDGFSASRFVDVIESEAVWEKALPIG
jgi:hypothetical protein